MTATSPLVAELEQLAEALVPLHDGFRLVGNVYVGRFRLALLLAAERITELEGRRVDARAVGSLGGKARAANLSPERRRAIAQQAANARWAKRGGAA